eukprot:TRINITY_DN3903_c0_g2_i1.p1 TRINITY_DN3903_c0_g2~~TRINITY_DN3903_c0_g2_i1.p1  ORF type:complete len:178 (+),score=42.67 TRINITY_DN3903_c0_g2_i1:134-667(+)
MPLLAPLPSVPYHGGLDAVAPIRLAARGVVGGVLRGGLGAPAGNLGYDDGAEAQANAQDAASSTELSPMDLTPMGIALMLLQPPFIYIIVAVLVCCCCVGIVSMFWSTFEPIVYAILDFVAMIVRGVVAAAKGIFQAIQRCSYPMKECVLNSIDSVDHCLHPYKSKKPFKDVASFKV